MRSSLKGLLFAGVAAVALALAGAAQADTTVNTGWNASGNVNQTGTTTGSTGYAWSTGGNAVAGSSAYHDSGVQPYGYGVTGTSLDLSGTVAGGGFIQSETDRTGSYLPLYGAAGQSVASSAFSSDGNAALVQHTSVNYAGLNDLGHYGVTQTPGGATAEASGTSIQVQYAVNTGAVGASGINVIGTGSASITQNYAGASAHGFSMGVGGGDYQLASFAAQGIGTVSTGGIATKSLSLVNTGGTIYGTSLNPASVTTTINYDTTGAAPGTSQTWNYGISGSN
jgi:hypothetical protein